MEKRPDKSAPVLELRGMVGVDMSTAVALRRAMSEVIEEIAQNADLRKFSPDELVEALLEGVQLFVENTTKASVAANFSRKRE